MALPVLLQKLFKSSGYGPELNDEIVSRHISVQDWSNAYDYPASTFARGSDGLLYWSVAQSGPNAGGARNPTADDGTYWQAVPLDDADVMHLSGDETITGKMTFLGKEVFPGGTVKNTQIVLADPQLDIPADAVRSAEGAATSIQFTDKHGFYDNDVDGHRAFFFEMYAPYGSSNAFQLTMRGANIPEYAGVAYGTGPVMRLVEKPNNTHYVLTQHHLIQGGNHPYLFFTNAGAPTKGTYPSANMYNSIVFADASALETYDQTNNRYGEIGCVTRSDGADYVYLTANLNHASDVASAGVMLWIDKNQNRDLHPTTNGTTTLGTGSYRWGQIYSSSATINTSDARLKTKPQPVPDTVLDAWGEVDFVQFQMLDSVARKGADKARLHNGLIAQRIDEAFRARGLDASAYGLFCWDSWDAEPADVDENGHVLTPAREAGDCYSLRYEEALCMEAAYQRRRADRAEARIAALEERLAALEARLA